MNNIKEDIGLILPHASWIAQILYQHWPKDEPDLAIACGKAATQLHRILKTSKELRRPLRQEWPR